MFLKFSRSNIKSTRCLGLHSGMNPVLFFTCNKSLAVKKTFFLSENLLKYMSKSVWKHLTSWGQIGRFLLLATNQFQFNHQIFMLKTGLKKRYDFLIFNDRMLYFCFHYLFIIVFAFFLQILALTVFSFQYCSLWFEARWCSSVNTIIYKHFNVLYIKL